MKVTPNQMKMLRRIYRLSVKRQGMGGTVWVHEINLHKSSMLALKQLGLVCEKVASDIPMPPHTNPPGWNAGYNVYILTPTGLKFVIDNTELLIGETVWHDAQVFTVVSWSDDYTVLELENKHNHGIFVTPHSVQRLSHDSVR